MADSDSRTEDDRFFPAVPPYAEPYPLKGSGGLGAHVVKTYYCAEGFDTVTAACPVPVVMAGGKKLPELDALTMAYRAIEEGAAGVDMGRNIFQCHDPVAMIRAVSAVVHESVKPQAAYDQYSTATRGHNQPEDKR